MIVPAITAPEMSAIFSETMSSVFTNIDASGIIPARVEIFAVASFTGPLLIEMDVATKRC